MDILDYILYGSLLVTVLFGVLSLLSFTFLVHFRIKEEKKNMRICRDCLNCKFCSSDGRCVLPDQTFWKKCPIFGSEPDDQKQKEENEMAEYNFWDDRTIECNDSMFCPVINEYCLDQRCNECNEFKQFKAYYSKEENESGIQSNGKRD